MILAKLAHLLNASFLSFCCKLTTNTLAYYSTPHSNKGKEIILHTMG